MTRRRTQVASDVDDRTLTMSQQALACRSEGHWWNRLPPPKKSRAEAQQLLESGMRERFSICQRCTAERRQVIDRETHATMSTSIKYPEDYLLQGANTGRLLRREARWAYDNIY